MLTGGQIHDSVMLKSALSQLNITESTLMVMTTAAVLGGSACGDNISPISDTTVLSPTGAGCDHIKHVSTQLPYGILAAVATAAGYVVGGFTKNMVVGLLVGIESMCFVLAMHKVIRNR